MFRLLFETSQTAQCGLFQRSLRRTCLLTISLYHLCDMNHHEDDWFSRNLIGLPFISNQETLHQPREQLYGHLWHSGTLSPHHPVICQSNDLPFLKLQHLSPHPSGGTFRSCLIAPLVVVLIMV